MYCMNCPWFKPGAIHTIHAYFKRHRILFDSKREARPDEPVRTGIAAQILFAAYASNQKTTAAKRLERIARPLAAAAWGTP